MTSWSFDNFNKFHKCFSESRCMDAFNAPQTNYVTAIVQQKLFNCNFVSIKLMQNQFQIPVDVGLATALPVFRRKA